MGDIGNIGRWLFVSHILQAAQHPIDIDERQANAVAARIELDLRIGAALTRLQTLSLQPMGPQLDGLILSYGKLLYPWEAFL